jgi:hypothetical protein
MASLQSRLSDLITAIGADIKNAYQYSTTASNATPTPVGFARRNQMMITAQAAAASFAAPSGTPVDGNSLVIRIKDNGTARALTWNAIYRALDTANLPLPSTTVVSKTMYLGFMYNAADSKWDLISILNQT